MRCKFTAKPAKIESSIDLPHQVIFGNRVAELKLVEQLTLVTLQMAHHGSTSPRFASTKRNHASRPLSTDFCNKIGQLQTHAPQHYSITWPACTSIRLDPLASGECDDASTSL
jgi:hypothetical protein